MCNFHDILHPGECDGIFMAIPNGPGEFNHKRCVLPQETVLKFKSPETEIPTKREAIVPTGCVVKYHCSNQPLRTSPALEIICENGTLKSLQGNMREKDTVCTGIPSVFIFSTFNV